jgi:hypothetical protein
MGQTKREPPELAALRVLVNTSPGFAIRKRLMRETDNGFALRNCF